MATPTNVTTYNGKTIIRYDYKIQNNKGQLIDTFVYIRASNGQIINPSSIRLTKDLVQDTNFRFVCCTTTLEACINSWITNTGDCWITEAGLSWGLP